MTEIWDCGRGMTSSLSDELELVPLADPVLWSTVESRRVTAIGASAFPLVLLLREEVEVLSIFSVVLRLVRSSTLSFPLIVLGSGRGFAAFIVAVDGLERSLK